MGNVEWMKGLDDLPFELLFDIFKKHVQAYFVNKKIYAHYESDKDRILKVYLDATHDECAIESPSAGCFGKEHVIYGGCTCMSSRIDSGTLFNSVPKNIAFKRGYHDGNVYYGTRLYKDIIRHRKVLFYVHYAHLQSVND